MKISNSRGDVTVYIALLLVTAMLGTALFLQLIISRQFRYTTNVLHSERALYAANSGLERMLAELPNSVEAITGTTITYSAEVPYPDTDPAAYEAWGKFIGDSAGNFCIYSIGTFNNETRYMSTGNSECVDELIADALN